MNSPKISVIVPVRNGEATLKDCLGSVLNQTYGNYEVIAVDNASKDSTGDIIMELQSRHKNLIYTFCERQGRAAARNEGLKCAKGEIIAMTDADCIVDGDWLECLTGPIIEGKEDAVMGFERNGHKNFWSDNIQRADRELFFALRDGEYINHLDTKNFAVTAGLMKNLMFDEKFHNFEDFDLYLRLKGTARVRFLPDVEVEHRHKSTFVQTAAVCFSRGYWTSRIYMKHKARISQENIEMVKSLSWLNMLAFPFWLATQVIKKPFKESFYILTSEVSWRMGIAWSLLKI